jgi:hypothetical protein
MELSELREMFVHINRFDGVMIGVSASTVEEWVGKWLLFNANSAIFQLYHGENKLMEFTPRIPRNRGKHTNITPPRPLKTEIYILLNSYTL